MSLPSTFCIAERSATPQLRLASMAARDQTAMGFDLHSCRGFAMASTQVTDNALDRALLELESLGLARPTNILLAEYLIALSAEGLLDATAVADISAAYNRVRYAAVPGEDDQTRAAAAPIEQIAVRLRDLPAEQREQLAQRIFKRLPEEVDVAATEKSTESSGQPSSPPSSLGSRPVPVASWPAPSTLAPTDDVSGFPGGVPVVTASPKSATSRWSRPWTTVEGFGLCCLATFFCGYFLREASQVAFAKTSEASERRRDVWVSPEAWVATIQARGIDELGVQHYRTARLALELALACSDDESSDHHAETLNALAWSYLFPDQNGAKDPPRALELVTKALAIRRRPGYIDTAAEAHYQLGNPMEAVRLEREALVRAQRLPPWRQLQLTNELKTQLLKFQNAERDLAAAKTLPKAQSPSPTGSPTH
jgi:tetratricopeptide (TPR) repeat protein